MPGHKMALRVAQNTDIKEHETADAQAKWDRMQRTLATKDQADQRKVGQALDWHRNKTRAMGYNNMLRTAERQIDERSKQDMRKADILNLEVEEKFHKISGI